MKEKRTNRLVIALVALMLIGFGVGGLLMAINKDAIQWTHGIRLGRNVSVDGKIVTREATSSIDNKQDLKIVNSVGEVEIQNHSGDKIEVIFHGHETSTLEVSERNNQVTIDAQLAPRNQTVNISGNHVTLIVKIPQTFTGHLEVTNGVGDMSVDLGEHTYFKLNCGVGDVTFAPKVLKAGNLDLSIGVGSITVIIPKGADVALTATTGVGGIKNRVDFDTYEEEGKIVSKSAEGTIGNGDAKLKIRLGTGDLILK